MTLDRFVLDGTFVWKQGMYLTFTECSEPVTPEQAETPLCRIYCRNVKVDEFFVANESDAARGFKEG